MTRREIARAIDNALRKANSLQPGPVRQAWLREHRRLALLYASLPPVA